jgi:hypothetical protein
LWLNLILPCVQLCETEKESDETFFLEDPLFAALLLLLLLLSRHANSTVAPSAQANVIAAPNVQANVSAAPS